MVGYFAACSVVCLVDWFGFGLGHRFGSAWFGWFGWFMLVWVDLSLRMSSLVTLVVWLVGCFVGWLVDYLVGRSFGWLVGCLDCLVGRLVELTCLLWLVSLVGCLARCGWLCIGLVPFCLPCWCVGLLGRSFPCFIVKLFG